MAQSLKFGYTIAGETQLLRRLDNISEMADDLSPLWNQLIDEFHSSEEKTFAAEGAFEGKFKWEPLSEKYAAWKASKANKYGNQPILVLSGTLKSSLTTRDTTGAHVVIEPQMMEVGSVLRVGKWNLALLHQMGTKRMPPREPVRFSAEEKKRWSRIVASNFQRRITEITKSGEEKTRTVGSGTLGTQDIIRRQKS